MQPNLLDRPLGRFLNFAIHLLSRINKVWDRGGLSSISQQNLGMVDEKKLSKQHSPWRENAVSIRG